MMYWKEEIKQKQDLINATLLEIEEIKIKNNKAILEPLKEKYLNKIVKINSDTYIYVTNIRSNERIDGIGFCCYGDDFTIEYDSTGVINDGYEVVSNDDLVEFINRKIAITLDKIK